MFFKPNWFHFAFQRQCEQARLREYEEKLIVTAWYNKVRSKMISDLYPEIHD